MLNILTLVLLLTISFGCATTSGTGGGSVDPVQEQLEASEDLAHVLTQLDRSHEARPATSRASPEHQIGPQDLLEIVVFDAPELSQSVRVSAQGDVVLPLLGVVPAAGSTPEELAATLRLRLGERYMRDPHVAVQVTEIRPRSVYVLGAVNAPGAFDFNSRERTTILQVVAMGGGVSPTAAASRAVLIRTDPSGERRHIPVDLDRALKGTGGDEAMLPDDILFVPTSTPRSILRGTLNTITRIITFRGIF